MPDMISPITFPMMPNEPNDGVENLHRALFVMLERGYITWPEQSTDLAERFKHEVENQAYADATMALVKVFQELASLEPTGAVDEMTAGYINNLIGEWKLPDQPQPPERHRVSGEVYAENRDVFPSIVIRAFDRDLRRSQQLGVDATPDADGRYVIEYDRDSFLRAEKRGAAFPNLFVQAFKRDENGNETQFDVDKTILNPTCDDRADFTLPAEPSALSEWERMTFTIEPLLEGQGERDLSNEYSNLHPSELNDTDLDFIAQETGLDREQCRLWALGFKAAADSLLVETAGDISAVFYGWFRLGQPTELSDLWVVTVDRLVASYRTAVEQRLTPNIIGEPQLRRWIIAIQHENVLQAPALGTPTRLNDLLGTMTIPLTDAQRRMIAGAIGDLRPGDPDLVSRLKELNGFQEETANKVAQTLRLGALTDGNVGLMGALQLYLEDQADDTISATAQVRDYTWINLAYQYGTPAGSALTPVAYAKALEETVERLYPTAALAAHLSEGRRLAHQKDLKVVGAFLTANPAFDLVTENLHSLSQQTSMGDTKITPDLVDGLRTLKRMHIGGVMWGETAVFMENGIRSLSQIADAGPERLKETLKGQIANERIDEIHAHVQNLRVDTFAAFTAIMSPLSGPTAIMGNALAIDEQASSVAAPAFASRNAVVLRSNSQDEPADISQLPKDVQAILTNQPTLQALFGSQDDCTCGHCQSVLSPAAYYVDLLQFAKNAGLLPKLLERRPDLVDLELSCENTNTVLPAIDLILETLENAVVPSVVIPLASEDPEQELRASPVGKNVTDAIKSTAQASLGPLDASYSGSVNGFATTWTVVDGHRRWTLDARRPVLQALNPVAASEIDTSIDLKTFIPELGFTSPSNEVKHTLGQFITVNWEELHADNYSMTLEPVPGGGSWVLTYQFLAKLSVIREGDDTSDSISLTLSTVKGESWWPVDPVGEPYLVSPEEIEPLLADPEHPAIPATVATLIEERFSGTSAWTIASDGQGTNTWTISSDPRQLTLIYDPAALRIASLAYQSGDVDFDALAEPENRNPLAYGILKGDDKNKPTVFPWTLPFDLPLEEVRLYLERAGSSRRQLIHLMAPTSDNEAVFVREVLGLGEWEAHIISAEPVVPPKKLPDVYECWGITATTNRIYDAASGQFIPLDNKTSATALELLQNVSILLQQSRMSFEELQAVLKTQFVKAGMAATQLDNNETCKPSDITLPDLQLEHLDRIHRFVRLQRRLGWTTEELDAAISATKQDSDKSKIALSELANLVQLHELLDLPIIVISKWWTAPESEVTRQRQLAKALGIGIEELAHAQNLFGVDKPVNETQTVPLTRIIPPTETLLAFCKRVKFFQLSNLTFEDLRYLLQHAVDETALSDVFLDEKQLTELLDSVRSAHQAIPDDSQPDSFPFATKAQRDAAKITDDQIDTLKTNLEKNLIASDLEAPKLKPDVDVRELIAVAMPNATEEAKEQFETWILGQWIAEQVAAYLLRMTRREAIAAALAAQLGVQRELIASLLARFLNGSNKPAIDALVDEGNGATASSTVKEVIRRLHKAVVICSALRMNVPAMYLRETIETTGKGFVALDFNALPIDASTSPDSTLVDDFEKLVALAQLRTFTLGATDLVRQYAMLNFADAETLDVTKSGSVYGLFGVGLGFTKDQVKQAADKLNITQPEHLRDPINLKYLLELLVALRHLDATVDEVRDRTIDDPQPTPSEPYGLIAPSPKQADAHAAKELLLKKYSDSERRAIIKPIADALRERQRDMLVDYLVHKKQLRNASDLYEYYLIDVELASCFKTTRLLMATAAVQLYIQRVMLNLEKGVSLKSDKRKQWEWMQSYRVWEANRKVFLFPENWLLPELRDDKTETFRQMESVLTQGEPTPAVTRNALLTYLDDLGELAQIQVIAMYEEDGTLYVIGRTPNTPYRHFLRSRTGDMWAGWEALDLDNANDFVMPFVFEGDLHIAWPTFKKTSVGEEIADLRWEVQIAWVRRTTQGWTKRKLSQGKLTVDRLSGIDEARHFVFMARKQFGRLSGQIIQDESIIVDCYNAKDSNPPEKFPVKIESGKIAQPKEPKQLIPFGGWFNVFLEVQGEVWEFYEKSDGTTVYRPAKRASVRMDYKKVWMDAPGTIASTWEPLSDSSVVNSESGAFSFSRRKVVNGEKSLVQLTFFHPDIDPTSSTLTSKMLEEVTNTEYQEWIWKPIKVIKLKTAPTDDEYSDDREVLIDKPNGSFVLSSVTDMAVLVPSTAGADEINLVKQPFTYVSNDVSNYKRMSRIGNRYVSVNGGNEIAFPLEGTIVVDHDFGSLLEVSSSTITTKGKTSTRTRYLRDELGSYFARRKEESTWESIWVEEWDILPDGQPFIQTYRRRSRNSVFQIFSPSTQSLFLSEGQRSSKFEAGISTSLDAISFNRKIPYANYNWELFLHTPLAIAAHLVNQQRFEDARQWLHAVFDPTTEDVKGNKPQFWRFLPFSNDTQPDANAALLTLLAKPIDPTLSIDERKEIEGKITEIGHQIAEWKKNPFMPHVIARLRPSAYQWYTFFAYLDVLIGWADYLFRRDTRESVNEATLLYVLAAKLLGSRPRTIPARSKTQEKTYRELQEQKNGNEDFWDPWINYAELGGFKPLIAEPDDISKIFQDIRRGKYKPTKANLVDAMPEHTVVTSLGRLAFCIPQNEKVTEYHNTLEDRLFKVRHCQNIDGEIRELPLYDPPIDPLLLIRARAAGLDLRTVQDDISTPLPHYRFTFTLQKALELCAELKSLGGALLSTLEKQDAEELALLRSSHEVAMLKLVQEIRERQVAEAEANIVALEQSEFTIRERFSQYQKLLGNTGVTEGEDGVPVMEQSSSLAVAQGVTGDLSGLGLIQEEVDQAGWMAVANTYTQFANITHMLSGNLSLTPNITFSTLPPGASFTFGGSNLGANLAAVAKAFEMGVTNANYFAGRANLIASYQRRRDEWVHQSKLALSELKQIKKQLLAAQIRKEIAEHELSNHDQQIKNAQQIEDFMRSKFTNQQLYRWMSNQISQLYFRTYQLAFDQAKRAERAYQHELGLETRPSFVRTGQWDNLKRGLLAGDQLHHDLKRMESAYLANNKREFEITKHVSLLQLDPSALVNLRETNKCTFELPEVLFDLDFPDHYLRRIKSVSLSIPCVTGPYASVSATLRLVASSTRYSSSKDPKDLVKLYGPITSIVTSSGQMDSGMFETNLRDERYLPFEGAGAVSEWELSLPSEFKQFDYKTISDVVLHIRYTAHEDTNTQKQGRDVIKRLNELNALNQKDTLESTSGLVRLFSLRYEFPTEWVKFKSATQTTDMEITLREQHFPFWTSGKTRKAQSLVWRAMDGEMKPLDTPSLSSPWKDVSIKLTNLDQTMNDIWVLLTYQLS